LLDKQKLNEGPMIRGRGKFFLEQTCPSYDWGEHKIHHTKDMSKKVGEGGDIQLSEKRSLNNAANGEKTCLGKNWCRWGGQEVKDEKSGGLYHQSPSGQKKRLHS